MDIILYRITDNPIKINKTLPPSTSSEYIKLENCILKDNTSVINPSVLIKIPTGHTYNEILNSNYCKLQNFGRYYFIENYVFLANDLIELILSIDVLYTYSSYINNLEVMVARSDTEYDDMIPDTSLSFESKDSVELVTLTASQSSLTDTFFLGDTNTDYNCENVLISVVNNKTNYHNSNSYNVPTALQDVFTKFKAQKVLYDYFSDCYVIGNKDALDKFLSEIVSDEENASYIKSIVAYPFKLPTSLTATRYMELGNNIQLDFEVGGTNLGLYKLSGDAFKPYVIADFTISINDAYFGDYEPYTQMQLYVPYDRWIDVTPSEIYGNRIVVFYALHLSTPRASVFVYNVTKKYVMYSSDITIGVEIGKSYSNQQQIDSKSIANATSGLLTGIGSGIVAIGGAITGNPIAVATGVLGAVGSMSNMAVQQMNLYSSAKATLTSGASGVYNPQRVMLKKTYKKLKTDVAKMKAITGKPCNKVMKISNITSGYFLVGNASSVVASFCTHQENEMIKNLLLKGVIK